MTDTKTSSNEEGLVYEMFIGVLSLLSLIDLAYFVMPDITSANKQVLTIIQYLLSIIFFLDFLYRFFTTQARSRYLFRDYGWADLLSCWPVYWLRILRLFRLAKVYQSIRDYGYKTVFSKIIDNRAQLTLQIVVILVLIFAQTFGNSMIEFERENPGANIKTGQDAMWFAFATITSIGCPDLYPTTSGGRILGIALMVCAVSIVSVFTAYITNSFLSPRKKKQKETISDSGEPRDPKTQIAKVKQVLEEQEKASSELNERLSELKERLEEIEKML